MSGGLDLESPTGQEVRQQAGAKDQVNSDAVLTAEALYMLEWKEYYGDPEAASNNVPVNAHSVGDWLSINAP